MRYQNTLQTAIQKAKAELEAAEKSLIIYNFLLTLDEFHEYDAFELSTDKQYRLESILTESEYEKLKKLWTENKL